MLACLVVLFSLFSPGNCTGATRTSTAIGGNWNASSTWAGGSVPSGGDTAVIVSGATVSVTNNITVASLQFNNASTNLTILAISNGVVLNVSGALTLQNAASRNTAACIQGPGTINCGSMGIGGTTTPGLTSSAFTATLKSSISNLVVSGNLTISALYNSSLSAANQGTFVLASGVTTVRGSVAFATVPLFGPILKLDSVNGDAYLQITGTTPFATTGGGNYTVALANGTMILTNISSLPSIPISFFNPTNSILNFSLAGSTTNPSVTTLITGDPQNVVNISSLPVIGSLPRQFRLLNYSGSIGGAGFNFVLGSMPGGVGGYLSNNISQLSIDLVITNLFPSELNISSVNNGVSPTTDDSFNVTIQSRDAAGFVRPVSTDTTITLGVNSGGGFLSGNLTGMIPAGSNSVTISGVNYSKAENSVSLSASATAGDNLNPGVSPPFAVAVGALTQLQVLLPGENFAPGTMWGKTGAPTPLAVGSSCAVTINCVDAHWNLVSTNHLIHLASTDSGMSSDPDGVATNGTRNLTVTFKTSGSQTITVSDLTDVGVSPAVASVIISPGTQSINFASPSNQVYGVGPLNLAATASSGLAVGFALISGPAVITNNMLIIQSVGSVSISATQPGDSNWNAATPVTQTISISPKPVTPLVAISNKVYDASIVAAIGSRTLTGVVSNDNVSLVGGSASFTTKNVGTARSVNITGLSISGPDAVKYVLVSTNASTNADIIPISLTVSGVLASNKVYNASTVASLNTSGANLVGVISNENVNLAVGSAVGSFADKFVGTNKTVSVSGLNLGGSDKNNYLLIQPTSKADITVRPLTVSAVGSNKVYDATSFAVVSLSDNRLAGETMTVSYSAANFSDPNAGTNKNVTVTGISKSGTDAANYQLTSTNASTRADITNRPLAITATGVSKIYDGTVVATVLLSDDRVPGDSLSIGPGSSFFASKDVGQGIPIIVTNLILAGSAASNYIANTSAATFANIQRATLSVVANDTNRLFGEANPAFTAKITGFVSGENTSVLSGSPAFSTSADKTSVVGSYPIQVNQGTLSASNYSFVFTNGYLVVSETQTPLAIEYIAGFGGLPDKVSLSSSGRTPGNTYHIFASPDLIQWVDLGAATADSSGTVQFLDATIIDVPARYYRLRGD